MRETVALTVAALTYSYQAISALVAPPVPAQASWGHPASLSA